MAAARTIWFSFHLGYHRSAVSLSALNVSLLTQTDALRWRSDPYFNSPPTKGKSHPTNTPISPLVPSYYWVLCGSIYPFPLVRHSSPLSAGVLHALLCLKVYSDVSMERDVLHLHLLPCPLVLFDFRAFYQMSFSMPGSHPGHHITFSCHVSLLSSWLWQILTLFLFLMSLKVLRSTVCVFCRMSLN